jgi:hypothetical protein
MTYRWWEIAVYVPHFLLWTLLGPLAVLKLQAALQWDLPWKVAIGLVIAGFFVSQFCVWLVFRQCVSKTDPSVTARCPKCQATLRHELAEQCVECGHSWHRED